MRHYNCNNKNDDKSVEIAGMIFIVGCLGFSIFIPWIIFDFFINGLDINAIIDKFGKSLLMCLGCITPFLTILVNNYIEGYCNNKQQKYFDLLLKDQILLSILNDKELKKNWKIFEKTVLLRTKEIVDNNLYSYNDFVYDLIKYKDNLETLKDIEEKKLLQTKLDDELAQKILNEKKDKIIK